MARSPRHRSPRRRPAAALAAVLLAALMLLAAGLAWAGEPAAQEGVAAAQDQGEALTQPTGLAGGDMTWALMKTVGGLAAVLGLMGILYWAMRRFSPGQALTGRAGELRVVGRLGLGPRKQLTVVKLADRVLVLGVSQDRVELLDKVTEPQAVARLTGEKADFAQTLERAGQGEQES